MYQEQNKEDIDIKKWNRELFLKILLFTSIIFVLHFFKINTDRSIIDLLGFIAMGGLLVSGGVF